MIAVTHSGDGHKDPPQSISSSTDVRSWVFGFDKQHGGGTERYEDHHQQQYGRDGGFSAVFFELMQNEL